MGRDKAEVRTMQRSESLQFIQYVNGLAAREARDRVKTEKTMCAQRAEAFGRKLRAKREKERDKADSKALQRQETKRINALKQHAWTRGMLKEQARRNGFDLDQFSYKPNPILAKVQSEFDITRLWGTRSPKASASPGIAHSGLPVSHVKHMLELKRSKSTLIHMDGQIIPEEERLG